MGQTIYKVLTAGQYASANAGGPVEAPIDVADGYVHFSTATQLQDTLSKWFKGQTGCVLVAFDADDFGARAQMGKGTRWRPLSSCLWPGQRQPDGGDLAAGYRARRCAYRSGGYPIVSFYDAAASFMRLLPAETAHRLTIDALKTGIGRPVPDLDDPRLAVTLKRSGLRLPNPIGLAAGFDKNAEVIAPMLGFGFGFVECGTVTPRPQPGNPRPRLFRLPEDRAVINRMGFNNEGLGPYVRQTGGRTQSRRHRRQCRRQQGQRGSHRRLCRRRKSRLAALHLHHDQHLLAQHARACAALQDRGALEDLLGRVGEAAREWTLRSGTGRSSSRSRPISTTGRFRHRRSRARPGLALGPHRLQHHDRPAGVLVGRHKAETGGLSGAPLMEKSTRVLAAFSAELKDSLDLIGVGGIASGADVLAKLRAGAQAVQLYTAMAIEGPGIVARIKSELVAMLVAEGATSLSELANG